MFNVVSNASRIYLRTNRVQRVAICLGPVRWAHILRDDPDDERQSLEVKLSFRKQRSNTAAYDDEAISIARQDPDDFGTSTTRVKLAAEDLPDDDDGYDNLEKRKSKRTLEYYEFLFNKLLHGHRPDKVQRGVQLLERMEREDRIRPQKHHYSMLIGACAHLGLAEKAFELFRQQFDVHRRKRSTLPPSQPTSLFNACGECEDSEIALEKARYLREYLYEMGFVCNFMHYNAMIKAFARHGDMATALSIVKEMATNRISINSQTYAMLLMGCITDKKAGLAHAIRIVRQMKRRRVPLEIHTFNLLLRCVRDCNVGSKDNLRYLFKEWTAVSTEPSKSLPGPLFPRRLETAEEVNNKTFEEDELSHDLTVTRRSVDLIAKEANEIESIKVPNLLKKLTSQQTRDLVDFDFESLSDPASRLYLIGGLDGVCQMMREAKVKPTAATATQLLDSLPGDSKFEKALIENMKEMGVRLDTDFYNMLIKRRCYRRDLLLARQTLVEMQNDYLYPDIVTFGVMSLGCSTEVQGVQLINDTKRSGFKLNNEIVGGLIKNATVRQNYDYLLTLLKVMKTEGINPEPIILENISVAIEKTERALLDIERGNVKDPPPPFDEKNYAINFDRFKRYFIKWLKSIEVEVPKKFSQQFEFEMTERPKAKFDKFAYEMRTKIRARKNKELGLPEDYKQPNYNHDDDDVY